MAKKRLYSVTVNGYHTRDFNTNRIEAVKFFNYNKTCCYIKHVVMYSYNEHYTDERIVKEYSN